MLLRKQLTPTLHKPLSVWLAPVLLLTALLQKSSAPISLTLTLRRHSQTPTQSQKTLPPNRLRLINSPTLPVQPSKRYRVYQRQVLPQSWLHLLPIILLLDRAKKTPLPLPLHRLLHTLPHHRSSHRRSHYSLRTRRSAICSRNSLTRYRNSARLTLKLKHKKLLKQLRKRPVRPRRKTTGNPPMAQAEATAGTAEVEATPGAGILAAEVVPVAVGTKGTVVVVSSLRQTTIPDP